MKIKDSAIQASLLGVVIAIMSACATTPPVENFAPGTNPSDEIQKLEADMGAANAEQLDVTSPYNYEKSVDALKDAKKGLADKDDAEDILEDVAKSRAFFKRAQEFGKVTADTLPDVHAARALALNEGAKESFSSDFRKADSDLKDVAEDIEKNDLSDAQKSRGELQAKYLDLELRAIQRNNLAEAEGLVRDAERNDAGKQAPRTLAIAKKSIEDASAYIVGNRHDTAQVKVFSDKALADARHVVKITSDTKTQDMNEEAALKLEAANQNAAARATELAAKEVELNKSAAAAAAAQATVDAKQAVDQKYEQARAMFTQNEAEVYRQGKNIVIRLRGLEFDSAKAQLKGASFPLLAKVNDVIAEFPASAVTVEGHTDSKGGKAINEKVSQARAEVVKSYFEANSKVQNAHYSAIGYDFQKPLASNKTEEGRAQNRRVDIVIAPEGI